jgi:diacylglycerol O-acyltransferase / wax synthase
MKQLSDQDATYLCRGTQATQQHVGSASMVEIASGCSGDFFQDHRQHVARRTHLLPLLHSRLVPMPLDVDHPVWVDGDSFDIDCHVRRQTVASPGRLDRLEELVGRLHSNALDRSRPLWAFYVIDGQENGQVAFYTKIHHAAMDGASSQSLIQVLCDPTPEPPEMPPPPPPAPASQLQIGVEAWIRSAVTNVVRHEICALQPVSDALEALFQGVLPCPATLRCDKPGAPPPPTPKSIFNVSISTQRSFAAPSLPMGPLKRVARQAGVKLNDVVLAVCSGALRTCLQERKVLPGRALTAIVPASLRDAGSSVVANQNALFICSLASDIQDPHERLMTIFASSTAQKKSVNPLRGTHRPDLMDLGSGPVMRAMIDLYCQAKLAEKLPQMGNLWVSNVPGPPVTLYVMGARIVSFHPCSIPFDGAALNITAECCADALAPAFDALKAAAAERHLAASTEAATEAAPSPAASRRSAAIASPSAGRPASHQRVRSGRASSSGQVSATTQLGQAGRPLTRRPHSIGESTP